MTDVSMCVCVCVSGYHGKLREVFRSPNWYCSEQSLNIPVLKDRIVNVFCNFTYCAVMETTIYSYN